MRATLDGNEAAASVAYRLNEVCCIYPITPASPMAEFADEWASKKQPNVWGNVPAVVELQSEGGAAGAVHGALQGGALSTTFTASQGLLLMIPNMYKIVGELTPTVFHVAARAVAGQALSIFGDHSDVMAVRQTGFAMLASSSVQEAHDLAAVAQLATLSSRVSFLHFFDGFRTSHELNSIELLSDDDLRALVPEELVRAHRERALSPERPFVRGTSHNPDVAFQARESSNPFYARTPGIVEYAMGRLAERSGRRYGLVDYTGHPEAERVVVVMGSAAETARETVAYLCAKGERVGVVTVRLYRPFPTEALLAAMPPEAERVAVLDRTKEPGALGEPLYLDVVGALAEAHSNGERDVMPRVTGGRYGLASKELTPGMIAGVFAELGGERPRRRFTLGIIDDVSGTSISYDAQLDIEPADTLRAVFFGLGSDGTVGANKNSVKILGSELYAQGYFVYDSKKSGSQTVSHLRFGPQPIRAPYLIGQASFVGCHQFGLLEHDEVLGRCAHGATLLVNSAYSASEFWDALARPIQEQLLAKQIEPYVIDATRIAREIGLGGRVNTVLQTCFFAISGVLDRTEAIERIKAAITKSYERRGTAVVAANLEAVDRAIEELERVALPDKVTSSRELPPDGARRGANVRPEGHRTDAGWPRRRPAGFRAAGRRHVAEWHGSLREAQDIRRRRGLGPGAVHPVRQLQLRLPPQRHSLEVLRPIAGRKGTGSLPLPRRCGRVDCPTPATPCRCMSTTAPAAGCASRPARRWRRTTRLTRRSTSPHSSHSRRPSGRTSRSSKACPSPSALEWTSAPYAAPSSSNPCSSSPVRAPAAARRRT